ncbi:MAG: PAS domain S-box protein, partial [Synechococcaceae cyanobacterium SM2_3_1]|nr:PAS domain S-box protein [Synechococcaceae cyanobacterium SM2_3_1]
SNCSLSNEATYPEVISYTEALKRVHPDDLEALVRASEQAISKCCTYQIEFRERPAEGSVEWRWVQTYAKVVSNGVNHPVSVIGLTIDITERKQIELELARNRDFREFLFNESNDALILVDPITLRQLDCNQKAIELLEADSKEEFLTYTNRHFRKRQLTPDELESALQMIETNGSWQEEVEYVSLKGKEFWGDLSVRRLRFGDQRFNLLRVVDISECKQTEIDLRRNQALLTQSQKMSHVGSFEWDILTYKMIWSDEMFRIFGMDPSKVTPSYNLFLERIYSDDLPLFISQLEVAVRGEKSFQKDYRIITPEGLIRYVEIRGECISDHHRQVIRLLGTVHDITERKFTEQSLQILQQAVKSSLNGILIFDAQLPHMPITYVNPAVENLTGYSPSEIYGKNLWLLFNQDQDLEEVNQLRQAIQKGQPCQTLLRNYRKDGTLFWNDLTISPIFNDQGVLSHYVGVQNDVTKQKLLEQHKDEFLAIVSHELRTPLTSIQGLLGLLSTGRLGDLSEFGLKLLSNAAEDTKRLNRLVEEILDLESLRIGGVKMQCQHIQVQPLLDRLIQLMQPLINDEPLQIHLQVQVETVWADPDRILQVLTNLVGNAVKFAAGGEQIQIIVSDNNGGSLWSVRDYGKGIPIENLEHLFEPFKQADSSSTRQKSGTGLGLAICRQIIEGHGGRIWATSSVQGTTFFFTLPETPDGTVKGQRDGL